METPTYSGVGVELKAARERLGATRTEFASRLRIREPYIGAIEEGRFADLPGRAYAVGFIRSYADSVDLDSEDLVSRFKRETAVGADGAQLRFPAPEAERRLPGARLLAVSVLLVAGVYGGWYYLSNTDRSAFELVPPVPDRLLASDTAPAQTDERQPVAAAATGDTGPPRANATPAASSPPLRIAAARETTPGAVETAVRQDVRAAGIEQPTTSWQSEVAVLPASPPPQAENGGRGVASITPEGRGAAESRVMLKARLDSWVQVKDENNELLLSRILRAGDTYSVPNRPGLTLLTGNAGVLEISVDGRTLPPIGPIGAVRRNISLDPEYLLGAARGAER